MANLKEVRSRISTINSTQQITSAMKMVAASKLRRTQNSILKMRPFASKLQELLQNLSASLDDSDFGSFSEIREPRNVLIVPVSSNRGLCGQFNHGTIRATNEFINKEYKNQLEQGNLSFLTIGKKVSEYYTKRKFNVILQLDDIFDNLTYENTISEAESLMQAFSEKKYDRIIVIYNRFLNAAVQKITVEQFLPITPAETEDEGQETSDFLFEPEKEQIVKELIPKSLKIQFYKMLLDSFASEHGARMTAMHIATENAKDILKDLRLKYNKARQAAITNEILEIVGGAEALKSK